MIDGEQIDNWQDNIATAREYSRRRRKGIPSDRWADGAIGATKVADGIDAQDWCIAYLVSYADQKQARIEQLEAELLRIGSESMEPWQDPKRANFNSG